MAGYVKGILGVLGIGCGTFGALVYSDVLKAEKVVLEKKLKAESELAQKQSAQAQVRSAEEAAELLMQDCDTLQKRLSETDTQLQEAKAEVVRLEGIRETSGNEQRQKQGELQTTLSRIASLHKDYFRHSEAHTIADREYQAAQKEAAKLVANRNPLNHPQVKQWLGQNS